MQASSHIPSQHHMLYADPTAMLPVPDMQQVPMLQQQHEQHYDLDNPKHAGLAKLAELRECVDEVSKDALKFFEKGNKAAGVRARKKLQSLKTLSQELRVSIQKCKSDGSAAGTSARDDPGHDDDGLGP